MNPLFWAIVVLLVIVVMALLFFSQYQNRSDVSDNKIEQYGNALYLWASDAKASIKINGLWIINADPLQSAVAVSQANLKKIVQQSQCQTEMLDAYFFELTGQVMSPNPERYAQRPTPEKLASDLNCLGKFEFVYFAGKGK